MTKRRSKVKRAFVAEIICRIAPQIGAEVLLEPEYGFVGQITFKNGKKVLFRGTNLNINPLGSSEIAKDKGYADFFLRHYGYKVPEGRTFFSEKLNQRLEIKRTIDDGYAYAITIGFPVILKPNNLSQGTLVTKVFNKRQYYLTARKILKLTPVMLVQRVYEGRDYRIVVLDDEVISAYERIPLTVVGDGRSTIAKLLKNKQDCFDRIGRDTELNFEDSRINWKLSTERLSLRSIPSEGHVVQLLDNANLSTGGDAVDVTEVLHPDYRRLSTSIARDMGLRMCGVDIMAVNISLCLDKYVVLEINSAPGLDNYASIGAEQKQKVDELYLKVLRALEATPSP